MLAKLQKLLLEHSLIMRECPTIPKITHTQQLAAPAIKMLKPLASNS